MRQWLFNTFWRFPTRLLLRPFKQFDALKYEHAGSYAFAFFVLFLEALVVIMDYVYKGFLINYSDIYRINSLYLTLTVLFPVALFVVGNWCVTTLPGPEIGPDTFSMQFEQEFPADVETYRRIEHDASLSLTGPASSSAWSAYSPGETWTNWWLC